MVDEKTWQQRYRELLDWIEQNWADQDEIPDELYHVSPRCPWCCSRHQGNC